MLRLYTFGGLRLEGIDGALAGPAGRRRPLAMLAVIAAAGSRGVSRDRLTGILWPESSDERAKHVLSQSLYALRKGLRADDLLLDGSVLRLNPVVITSDVQDFNTALELGDLAAAVELFAGPFLDGFYLSGVASFEQWVEEERARLTTQFRTALDRLAAGAERSNDVAGAVRLWRKLVELDPLAAEPLAGLVRALDATGDRAAALRQVRIHAALVEQEGGSLSPSIAALRDSLHAAPPRSPSALPIAWKQQPAAADPSTIASATTPEPSVAVEAWRVTAPTRSSRRPMRWIVASVVIAACAAVALVRYERDLPTVLAVGMVESHLRQDSVHVARALPDLMTTQLAQVKGLSVVSRARLLEVLGDGVRTLGPGTLARAATAAGASEIVEGAIYATTTGMRLDLRRVALPTGKVREAVSVNGSDAGVLVERAVAALAQSFHLDPPREPLASVTSVSLVARRFYEEGLRWYYAGDLRTAAHLFDAALADDSTFAMAAYYLANCQDGVSYDSTVVRWNLAAKLAPHASDRERLLILASRAFFYDDARQLPVAETLSVRYPSDLDGKLILGDLRQARGDFVGAHEAFLDVVRIDSAGRLGRAARCRACEAMERAVWVNMYMDSLARAERLARELISWDPRVLVHYEMLGTVLLRRDDFRGAIEAFRKHEGGGPATASRAAQIAVARRSGDFRTLDSTVSSIVRAPRDVGELQYGLELQSAVLRERGQPGPALEAARRFHRVVDSVAGRPSRDPFVRLPEALALLELGATDPRAARAAAKLFNDMATMPMYSEPRMARHRVWMWTHEASALALAGDTAALPGLARRIEEQSLLSAYGRDQRMPFYVTGLLLEARRDWLGAAEAYRRAIWSPTENHVSPRLARALLASGRPAEAIPVLQSWLRGPLDAANQYVRRSEVHRLLGEAFQKLNRQDSASAHYAWVRGAGRPAPSGAQ